MSKNKTLLIDGLRSSVRPPIHPDAEESGYSAGLPAKKLKLWVDAPSIPTRSLASVIERLSLG